MEGSDRGGGEPHFGVWNKTDGLVHHRLQGEDIQGAIA